LTTFLRQPEKCTNQKNAKLNRKENIV